MDPIYLKLLAILYVAIFFAKRAIVGPQKTFARTAVLLEVVGLGTLAAATQKDDFTANVGAVFMLIGMLFAIGMVAAGFVQTVRSFLTTKNP